MGLVPVTKRLPKEPLSDTILSIAPACTTTALTENENPPKVSAKIKIGQQLQQPFLPFKAKTSETHCSLKCVQGLSNSHFIPLCGTTARLDGEFVAKIRKNEE